MSKYRELVAKAIFDENPNSIKFENYCLEVNDILLNLIENVDEVRQKMLKDSIDKTESCTYIFRKKVCTRYEMISLIIQDDIKNKLKSMKMSLDFLVDKNEKS